jgi:hypothetical protein
MQGGKSGRVRSFRLMPSHLLSLLFLQGIYKQGIFLCDLLWSPNLVRIANYIP